MFFHAEEGEEEEVSLRIINVHLVVAEQKDALSLSCNNGRLVDDNPKWMLLFLVYPHSIIRASIIT
jgi:hypothetical protein